MLLHEKTIYSESSGLPPIFFPYSSDYLAVALLTAQMKPVEQTDVLIWKAMPVLMQLQSSNFVNDKLTVMRPEHL